ncbi:MAG TPA: molybdenum ABC transporter ATP-binding protein [Gammaproteobacteria bacterium]|nr:molybdenum ABC transporter ATP-binding protein [Gammaproteobacteria bacterium]
MSTLSMRFEIRRDRFRLRMDEDLELAPITAIFGPSGAGKTTLLRTLAGLERGARGRLALDAAVWQDSDRNVFTPAHKRRIGYVFQDGRLFAHLDVARNLLFGHRKPAGPTPFAYDDVVAAMDLGKLLDRKPQSLSGGEQQRVAIGRALLRNPVLMLMDEPLSALDLKRKAEIIPYIERVAGEFQVPIIYVTHTIEEVTRLASRMIMLADGRAAATGTVAELLERIELWPASGPAAAGALLATRVEASAAGMTTLLVAGQRIRIPAIEGTAGTLVHLRVAAKDVAIATTRPTGLSIRNVLDAKILRIDAPGPVLAELLLEVGDQRLRAEITREAVDELELTAGQRVYALIKSAAIDRSLLA